MRAWGVGELPVVLSEKPKRQKNLTLSLNLHRPLNLTWLTENRLIRLMGFNITTDYKFLTNSKGKPFAFIGEQNEEE